MNLLNQDLFAVDDVNALLGSAEALAVQVEDTLYGAVLTAVFVLIHHDVVDLSEDLLATAEVDQHLACHGDAAFLGVCEVSVRGIHIDRLRGPIERVLCTEHEGLGI